MLYTLLKQYGRPYYRQVSLVVLMVLVQSIANLYLPNLNADLINHGIAVGNLGYIWRVGGIMLGVTLLVGIFALVGIYYASQSSMGIGKDIRGAVFRQVQHFSQRDMNHFGTPSLITRNTNDVQQIQIFLQMALTIMVAGPIMLVGGVAMALYEDARLSLLLVVNVPLIALVIWIMLVKAIPLFRTMQVRIDRINTVLREQITGVRVIRAFIRTRYEQERFETANQDLTTTTLRVNRIFVFAMPSMMAIMNLSYVAVLWFGGHLVGGGSMPIGNMTAFLNYILLVLMAVMMSTMMVILLPRAAASAARLQEVLETVPSVAEAKDPVEPASATGTVSFEGVTFAYPGGERPVLQDLAFSLSPGRTTAIVGGTGAGKTTLINLIARFYDVTAGRLLVDGVDVRSLRLERLWNSLGLVPQAAYLFAGTIRENVLFGNPDAPDDEIWRALEVAQAKDFVRAMPDGLDTAIDQGGTNVSGGQRQRLSIARALVRQRPILLFDDCFSALDAATDARLRQALRSAAAGSTLVIVAQRVSTILHADLIIVLEDGRVVGTGTHQELLATCPQYRELVQSQLGEGAAS